MSKVKVPCVSGTPERGHVESYQQMGPRQSKEFSSGVPRNSVLGFNLFSLLSTTWMGPKIAAYQLCKQPQTGKGGQSVGIAAARSKIISTGRNARLIPTR